MRVRVNALVQICHGTSVLVSVRVIRGKPNFESVSSAYAAALSRQ